MLKRILLIISLWGVTVWGQSFSPIKDEEGLFSKSWQQSMAQSLIQFYQQTQVQLQIVTTPDFAGESIEAYSIKLVEQLKLGQAQTDKGLLLLISAQQRKVRLEVGQGLEGEIPDLLAKRIIDQFILPEFKNRRYEQGVSQAVAYIQTHLGGEAFAQPNKTRSGLGGGFLFLIIILIGILKLGLMGTGFGRSLGGWPQGGGGGWPSGGSGGGGSWGGGGGGFSGGGASGSW